MVYSNNKSHKLLTILLVITLYFVAMFFRNNVFGAQLDYEFSDSSTQTITLPSWVEQNNYNYFLFVTYLNTTYTGCLIVSKGDISVSMVSPSPTFYCNEGIARTGFLRGNFSYIQSTIQNFTEPSQFTTSTEPFGAYDSLTSSSIQYISNVNITNYSNGTTLFPNNSIQFPQVANSLQDLETLNFDVISVNAWSWSDKDFDILFYDNNVTDTSNTDGLYPKRVITLNQDTSYFQSSLSANPNTNAIYWIPIDEIGLNLYVGGSYVIKFAERVSLNPSVSGADYSYNYLGEPINFTISSDVSQDKINAINKAIEDMTNQKYHDETINSLNNLNEALTNTTPDSSVSSDIDTSLNFDNNNQGLNNLNGGFFSRLTSMLSNLLGYNLGEDTSVSIPLPNTDKSIVLHSKDIYDNVTGTLRLIINAFWVYIFTFYMWKFINKIYIAVSTGNILDGFSSGGEAITNDML